MSKNSLNAVLMPKWGLAMHEGTIADWHVAEGEHVSTGTPICDIETNKITSEFESPFEGTLLRLVKQHGDVVNVGEVIAVIGDADTPGETIDALIAEHASVVEDAAGDAGEDGVATVETDVGEIAYRAAGDEEASEIVVLLHGFGGDNGNWSMLQAALPANLRSFAMDLPGHGSSTRNVGDGTARELGKAVQAFIQALELGPVHLVAHSYGAIIAASAIAQNSAIAKSLTVIAPPALGASASRDYVEGFISARRKKEMRPIMEMLFSDADMVSRVMVNEAIAAYREDEARNALETVGAALLAMKSSDPADDSKFLAAKNAIIIWGDRDRVVPLPDAARELASDRLELFQGVGHMPHVEDPGGVAKLIERAVYGK